MTDTLKDIFQIEEEPSNQLIDLPPKVPVVVPDHEAGVDFNYARHNYYEMIEKGKAALEKLGDIAYLSEHPRAYEVFSALLRNLAEVNKQLLDIGKEEKNKAEVKTVTNNMQFIGTSADLNKLIADKMENL